MSNRRGLDRFQHLLIDWISTVFTLDKVHDQALVSSQERELVDTVFKRFTELTDALGRLDLCLEFVRSRPPKLGGVKLDDYLLYHITFYLQEIYILRERTQSYAKAVRRLRKRLVATECDATRLEATLGKIDASLSKIVGARGSHVHNRAFYDDEMKDLSMYAFLANHALHHPEWKPVARALYREAKSTWIARFEENRAGISRVLDDYFDEMFDLVTTGAPGLIPDVRRTVGV